MAAATAAKQDNIPERGGHSSVASSHAHPAAHHDSHGPVSDHHQPNMGKRKESKVFRQADLEQHERLQDQRQHIRKPHDETRRHHSNHQQPEGEDGAGAKHFKSSLQMQEHMNATSEQDFKRFDSRSRE